MSKLVLKIYKRNRKDGDDPSDPQASEPIAPDIDAEVPIAPQTDLRDTSREERVTKVKYKVLIPMEGKGFTQDASRDGFCVFLDKEVPPGAVMEMKFRELNSGENDNNRPHPIGKVVWQKDHKAGIKVLKK
jgi:hypothetical protein